MDNTESSPGVSRVTRREFLKRGVKSAGAVGGASLSSPKVETVRRGLEAIGRIGLAGRGLEIAAGVGGLASFACSSYESEPEPQTTPEATNPRATPTSELDKSYDNLDNLGNKFEPISTPTEFIFTYKENVPNEERKFIEEAAESAREYFFQELGTYIKGPLRYNVENDSEKFFSASYDGNSILLNIGSPDWRENSPLRRRATTAHEQFHAMQQFISGRSISKLGKFWLAEGAADYAGWMANVNDGLISHEEMINQQIQKVQNNPIRLPIHSIAGGGELMAWDFWLQTSW